MSRFTGSPSEPGAAVSAVRTGDQPGTPAARLASERTGGRRQAVGSPRRGPGRPAGQPPRTRQEILAAAAEVFRRVGYHAARMDDVADQLGLVKASLYHYVRTKHELLFDIVLPPYRDFVVHLDLVLAGTAPVPDRIAEVVHRHFGNVARYSPAISIYVENRRWLPVPAELVELDGRYLHGLRTLIAAGMADGTLLPGDPAVAADALLGMCSWFAIRHADESPEQAGALATTIASIFLDGLSQPAARRTTTAAGRG